MEFVVRTNQEVKDPRPYEIIGTIEFNVGIDGGEEYKIIKICVEAMISLTEENPSGNLDHNNCFESWSYQVLGAWASGSEYKLWVITQGSTSKLEYESVVSVWVCYLGELVSMVSQQACEHGEGSIAVGWLSTRV